MSRYGPLYSFSFEHEYFHGNKCRDLECVVPPKGQELLALRGLIFRRIDINEWTLLYDKDGAGIDTSSDVLTLGMMISVPAFVLHTLWDGFDPSAAYRLELPTATGKEKATDVITKIGDKRKMGVPLCIIEIKLNESIWRDAENGSPKRDIITFQAPSCIWEYLFIKSNNKIIVPERLRLEADKDIIMFKPMEVIPEFGMETYRTESEQKIPMRENYDAKLNLIMMPEGAIRQKQVLLRNVINPQPGKFRCDAGKVRQVCYF